MPVRRERANIRGFTLIELVVVIAILGIVLIIAVPMFAGVVATVRITSEIDDLNGSISYARSEAIKQGLNVIVCPSTNSSSDTPTCADQTSWATGWLVIASSGSTCSTTTGVFLRQKNAFTSTDVATYTPRTAGNNYICFSRYGVANSDYTGLFVLAQSDGVSSKRCLSLSTTGVGQTLAAGATDASGVTCQ